MKDVVIDNRSWAGWQASWQEFWKYRDLLSLLTRRNIAVRFRQTVFGPLWGILQPLVLMIVFSVIFGRLVAIPTDGVPYPLFVYAGLIPWTFFATLVNFTSSSVVDEAYVITRTYFPRVLLPLSFVGVALLEFLASSLIFAGMMIFRGVPMQRTLLFVPALLLIMLGYAVGLGLMVAAVSVRIRDVRYLVSVALQVWLWLSPVVYSALIVPAEFRPYFRLNPMAHLIDWFRWAWLGRTAFEPSFGWLTLGSGLFVIAGWWLFHRLERRFSDSV